MDLHFVVGRASNISAAGEGLFLGRLGILGKHYRCSQIFVQDEERLRSISHPERSLTMSFYLPIPNWLTLTPTLIAHGLFQL